MDSATALVRPFRALTLIVGFSQGGVVRGAVTLPWASIECPLGASEPPRRTAGKATRYRFLSPLRLVGLSPEVAEKGKEDEGQTADFDGPLPLIREKFEGGEAAEILELDAADDDVEAES